MGISYVKFCPRCQTTTAVATQVCVKCGHQFRTQFQPPVSERTVAMVSVDSGAEADRDTQMRGTSADGKRPRRPPRVIVALAAAVLALGAVYAGQHLRHQSEGAAPAGGLSVANGTTALSYAMVVRGDAQGNPAPLATQSADDLVRWADARPPDREAAGTDTDSPARVHLYLSDRVLPVAEGTAVRVLQDEGPWRRVQVLEGLHRGATGFMDRKSVAPPTALTRATPQP